jgi:hypothetical protein
MANEFSWGKSYYGYSYAHKLHGGHVTCVHAYVDVLTEGEDDLYKIFTMCFGCPWMPDAHAIKVGTTFGSKEEAFRDVERILSDD